MKVIINGKEFTAELSETKAATEFSELLPLTFEMEELNGNEKCRYLSRFNGTIEKAHRRKQKSRED